MSWKDHPLCGPSQGYPGRFWGPEYLDREAWNEFAARLRPEGERALLGSHLRQAGRVLDVGAGSGLLGDAMARPGAQLVQVEPDAALVKQLPVAQSALRLRSRAESLPFAAGSFDAVVSTWILSYTSDPAASVREIARVCSRQPGSRVVIVQAAPGNDLVTLYNACAEALGEPCAHHGFLLAGAAEVLEASGFAQISLALCPVAMDFTDLTRAERIPRIASLVRRLHHRRVPPELVEPAIAAATAALPGVDAGMLRDDGVLLLATVA